MIARIPALVTCAMLLWALAPHNPSRFFLILRVVVFAYFVFCAIREFLITAEQPKPWVGIAFAVLFNPFRVFVLGRSTWVVVDIITVLVIVWMEVTRGENVGTNKSGSEIRLRTSAPIPGCQGADAEAPKNMSGGTPLKAGEDRKPGTVARTVRLSGPKISTDVDVYGEGAPGLAETIFGPPTEGTQYSSKLKESDFTVQSNGDDGKMRVLHRGVQTNRLYDPKTGQFHDNPKPTELMMKGPYFTEEKTGENAS